MVLPKGFTLIELLLVVSIIIIVTGSMVPSFSKYVDNQGVKLAQEQIKSDLRLIQNRALSNVASLEDVGGGLNPAYWGMRFTAGSDSYTYFISAVNTGCLPTNNVQKGISTKFSTNVESKNSTCVFFDMLDGDISTSPASIFPVPIIVGRTDSTYCRRTELFQSGLVDGSNVSESCNP